MADSSNIGPPWTDSPQQLVEYQVMRELARGESDCVEIAHTLASGPGEVRSVFVWLIANGLAGHPPLRMGDTEPEDAFLTAQGKAVVRAREAARTPARMRQACGAALLAWLAENDGRNVPGTDGLLEDVRGHFYGVPFSENVLGSVVDEMKSLDLLTGIGTFGPLLARPRITPTGRLVHTRHNGDLSDWLGSRSSGDTYNIHNSTGVVVANRSPHAQQSVHVSVDAREQVLNFAAALEQMMGGLELEPVDVARAAGLVVQLREAAQVVDEDPGRVRRLLETAKEVAVSGAGSAAGTALVALADLILSHV